MPGCRPLNDDEIKNIKSILPIQRDRTLFVLGLRTGLRISELLSIKIGDVYKFNRVTNSVKLMRHQVKGKRESIEIVLHKDAINEIEKLLGTLDSLDPSLYLFASPKKKGFPITRVQAHRIIKDAVNALELDGKISTHSMRKSLAWNFYNKSGHDLRATQKALKHKFISTTINYLDPDQKDVDKLLLEL